MSKQIMSHQPQPGRIRLTKLIPRLRSAEASEIAEAALVLPVVFLFMLGIIWFGRAFNIYATIQQAAQQGAILAARPACATCSAYSCGSVSTNFPCDTAVYQAVTAVMNASSVAPSQITDNRSFPAGTCTTNNSVTVCRGVQLNIASGANAIPTSCGSSSTPSNVCGVLVTFQYPFSFSLPFTSLNWSTITLTAQAQSRMEN
jgi:Flp pilus assembly protein TadG